MLFNTTVKDAYGVRKSAALPKDAVGIEIEMEHRSSFDYSQIPLPGWGMKTDGSLRNFGLELVSDPFSIKDIGTVVGKTWAEALAHPAMKGLNHECPRASVHVHVNVLHFTYNQLMNVITAYGLLEGTLIDFCGKYRKGNLFALAIPEAPGNFNVLRKSIKDYTKVNVNSDNRYSALNLCSMSRFGTLEFRMLGSSYSPELISMWVTGLRHMVDHAAYGFKNPPAVYDKYVHATREEFVKEFLGDLGSFILKKPLTDAMFEPGEDAVVALLACSPDDWTYEKDFRLDKEYFEALKKDYGYTTVQITSLQRSNYESWKKSKENKASPKIRVRSSPDWSEDLVVSTEEEPEEFVEFQPSPSVSVAVDPGPSLESFRTREDSLPRGERTIRWTGVLPSNAFFSRRDYDGYITRARISSEAIARMEFDARSLIQDTWVDTQFRRWAENQRAVVMGNFPAAPNLANLFATTLRGPRDTDLRPRWAIIDEVGPASTTTTSTTEDNN